MKFKSDIEVQAGLKDSSGSAGTSGQVLSSTVTGTSWITTISSMPTLNQVLTAGNTSQIDANVGIMGLYDYTNSGYSYITGDRNRINFYSDTTTRLGYFGNNAIAFDNNPYVILIKGPDTLSGSRTIKFPDATGTVALTSDIHASVTIGTANGLSLIGQQLSLGLSSSSANGALSSTDWTTFNAKVGSADNGLTLSGTVVKLGGTLLQNTSITGGAATAYNLTLTNGDLILSKGSGTAGTRGNLKIDDDRNIFWGGTNHFISGSTVANEIGYTVPPTAKHNFSSNIKFRNYGAGTKTGTAAYNLAVTSAGDIIETAMSPVIPTFTSGSVIFSNGTTLAQDNANFFWDDTNNRLGIGTSSPGAKFEVLGTNSASPSRANASAYIIGADVGLAVGQYNAGLFGTWMQSLRSTDNLAFPLSINPSGGNVAIGKASPSTALDVNGVITATGGSSTSWNAKQDALVSGTNIRTVNGQSLVGAGGVNVLFAHGLVPVPTASGLSYSQSIDGGGFGVIGGTANRMYLAPFITTATFNSISLSIQVTSAVPGAVIRLLLYSNSGGRPQGKLWESASLDCSTTGVKTAALTTSFTAGSTVWIGVHSSSTAGTYALSATQLIPLYNLNGSTTVSSYYLTAAIGSAPATITSGLTGHTGSIPMAVINV